MKKLRGILLLVVMMLAFIPSAFAQDYAYIIENVYFTDLSGKIMENPGRSCVVNVDVEKRNIYRIGNDVVVIASYATDGSMIGFTTVAGPAISDYKTYTFSTLVTVPADKTIGIVKAYIWNNISEMKPLSAVYQTVVNGMDEDIYLPPIDEKPIVEKYIPDTITVTGTITDTKKNTSSSEFGEYEISNIKIPLDISNIYTEEDYDAYAKRMGAIGRLYDITVPGIYTADSIKNVKSEINLASFLYYNCELQVRVDGDGECIVTSVEVKSVPSIHYFDADDYVMQECLADANQYSSTNQKIRFGSEYYKIENSVDIYVNNMKVDTVVSDEDVEGNENLTETQSKLDRYFGNKIGMIRAIDVGEEGYDVICVDIWNVAKVKSVTYHDEYNYTSVLIETKNALAGAAEYGCIIINDNAIENGTINISVEKNGVSTELTSLAKDDIIAYRSDIGVYGEFYLRDPQNIEIFATNDTASGKVTSIDSDEKTCVIDGTEYSMVIWGEPELSLAETYTFTLDPFGRIYDAEKDSPADLYAIALSVTQDGGVKMVLTDGTIKTYPLESDAIKNTEGLLMGTTESDLRTYLADSSILANRRIVKYNVRNSTGEINYIDLVMPSTDNWDTFTRYISRTGKLGELRISDITNVIDASNAKENPTSAANYAKFDVDNLKDVMEYKFVAINTGPYPNLVVIAEFGRKFDANSRFAVVKKAPTLVYTDDGDEVESVTVLLDGEADKQLYFELDVFEEHDLDVGDAFFYEINWYGYVSDVFRIYDASASTFTTLEDAITARGKVPSDYIVTDAEEAGAWDYTLVNSAGADIQLVEGYVAFSDSDMMAFAEVVDPLTRVDTTKDIKSSADGVAVCDVTDDTQAYLYDVSNTNIVETYDRFSVKYDTSSLASTGLDKYWVDGVYDVTNIVPAAWNMAYDANYAIAMIVDGEVVEVYVIK